MTIKGELSELFLKQFQCHQQIEDDGVDVAALFRANKIKKQFQIWKLNHSIGQLSLKQEESKEIAPNDVDIAISTILVGYIDAAVSDEVTQSNQDSIDNVLELAAAVAVMLSEYSVELIITRAIQFSTAVLERVRCQGCRLLGFLSQHLQTIENEDYRVRSAQKITASLQLRLMDKSQAVRSNAINAYRLFFTCVGFEEQELYYSEIVECLVWNLWHDPSVTNRAAAVVALPFTLKTADHIIGRIRDVKEKVRVQALDVLLTKVKTLEQLSSDQCATIIRSGLHVRCNATKNATIKLICTTWMKAANFEIESLLKHLSVVDNEPECEKVVQVVLQTIWSGDDQVLSFLSDPEVRALRSNIDLAIASRDADSSSSIPMNAEYWLLCRVAAQCAQSSNDLSLAKKEDILSKTIPDIPILCELLEKRTNLLMDFIGIDDAVSEDNECFVCLQLIHLVRISGLTEEGSRRHFAAVMEAMLSRIHTPDDLVEPCVIAMRVCFRTEVQFWETMSSITEDPVSRNGHSSDVDRANYQLRNLSILSIVLENASPKLSLSPFVERFADTIIPCITSSNKLVREVAVSCFGKLGLFTNAETILNEFKPLMFKIAFNVDETLEIRGQALLGLADWTLMNGDVLKPCYVDNVELSLEALITELMDHGRHSVVSMAAEIAVKLMFAGRVCESKWLARLLLIYFDPNIEDIKSGNSMDDLKEIANPMRSQQLLSLFFPAYTLKSDIGCDALFDSLGMVLELIYCNSTTKSKKKKKGGAWPIARILDFVCSIVDTANAEKSSFSRFSSTPTSQSNASNCELSDAASDSTSFSSSSSALKVAIQVTKFLVCHEANLTVTDVRLLCKFLGNQKIGVEINNKEKVLCLREQMEELGMIITDQSSLRSLDQLNEALDDVHEQTDP